MALIEEDLIVSGFFHIQTAFHQPSALKERSNSLPELLGGGYVNSKWGLDNIQGIEIGYLARELYPKINKNENQYFNLLSLCLLF